jgi:hypothetical protein
MNPKAKIIPQCWGAHTCNPSYLGGRDQKDQGSKPDQANSSQDPISKITRAKETGDMAQVVKCLPTKLEAINSNPSSQKKKKILINFKFKIISLLHSLTHINTYILRHKYFTHQVLTLT